VKIEGKRVCELCGAALSENSEFCPVCALKGALSPELDKMKGGAISGSELTKVLSFQHRMKRASRSGRKGRNGLVFPYHYFSDR